ADQAKRVRPADPAETLAVTICVRRKPESLPLPGPQEFAAGARPRLTQEQFAAFFGASEADFELVERFAATHGLKTSEKNSARRTVVLTGTVQQMNRAFGVELNYYETPDEKYRGREGPIHVPAELAEIVTGVFGLDNRQVGKLNGDPAGTKLLTP